jgi:outer membrane receptor protein involved in Fe transport
MPATKIKYILPVLMITPLAWNASAQSPEESDLALTYGDVETISVATGATQPLARAPAVASVITSAQIKDIGATDLDQILETVPGLHVAVSTRAYDPIYTIRGIYSDTNPQVLMLINGIPITNVFIGNRSDVWGGMPVNDISRIEIIRGPGSAVYGADAFAGVINIITKDAEDINGTEVGARLGSFNSKDAWLLHGGKHGGADMAFSLEYGTTDGQRQTIEADAQSGLDTLFAEPPYSAPPVSLAPGPVNLGRKYLEARFDASRDNWRLRLGYQGRHDVGTGAGVAQALDPAGTNKSDRYNADISYHLSTVQNWDTTAELSYFDTSALADLTLFPPGAFAGTFPNGVIGNPYVYERHTRLDLSTFYTGWMRHRARFGAGINYSDLYKVKESKNFTILPGGIPVPLGGIVDVSDSAAFITPHNRSDRYLFTQDEWSFANDWALTAGIRYDTYSDFGDTLNPRAALVWQTAYNLTSKLLYGRAFRAPSFAELYNINNPVSLGNPDLNPETIDTFEVAFDYQPSDKIRTGLNLFHYHMSDIIRFLADPAPATTITAQNAGDQKGYGLEWEINWSLSNALKLNANYAFQHSEDQTTNSDAGNAPHHEIYGRLDWRFAQDWSFNPQITWVGERQRAYGDTRPPLKGYTLVDVILRRIQIKGHFECAASVRNLFDADAREPSLSPGLIPNDLPLAGRNFYVELRYNQ